MHAKNYNIPKVPRDQLSASQTNGPINIEKLILDPFTCPPKGEAHWTIYYPNYRASQHYNIIEYLDEAPCAMSTFEVIKSCPT